MGTFVKNLYFLVNMHIVEKTSVQGKRDMLTGQRRNKVNAVSFSNKKSRKWQQVNIRRKLIYWPEGQRFAKLRIAARSIRTIEKRGLSVMAKEAGIDLWKLPFRDLRPQRLEYKLKKSKQVPLPK